MEAEDSDFSRGAGPSDAATMRVVQAAGSTFNQALVPISTGLVLVTPSTDSSTATVSSADSTKQATIIFNDSDKDAYLKFGAGATLADFSKKLAPGESYEPTFRYTGILTAKWAASPTGNMRVTEIRD